MHLIGMLDSPYVRRVAISLRLLGLPFEHRPLSVFGDFEAFARINPLVKAPTLVCADGGLLMDSTLILDHAEGLAAPSRRLMPVEPAARQAALHTLGLVLASCEKAVQLVYEQRLRPTDRQHQPWIERVGGQLRAGCAALEAEEARRPRPRAESPLDQAGLSLAVVWQFIQAMLPEQVPAERHPALQAWSRHAEGLPAFIATPPR